jgi:hypothetical protein
MSAREPFAGPELTSLSAPVTREGEGRKGGVVKVIYHLFTSAPISFSTCIVPLFTGTQPFSNAGVQRPGITKRDPIRMCRVYDYITPILDIHVTQRPWSKHTHITSPHRTTGAAVGGRLYQRAKKPYARLAWAAAPAGWHTHTHMQIPTYSVAYMVA